MAWQLSFQNLSCEILDSGVETQKASCSMAKSLLFIGFFDSPHFARWIENVLESTDYELTIFCSSPARRINPYLHRLISENHSRLRISKHSPKNPFFAYLADKIPLVNQTSNALKKEIGNSHDIIHYFEMQHSGYLLLPLISELRSKRVVYSNYGSDIFWFKKYKSHRKKNGKGALCHRPCFL